MPMLRQSCKIFDKTFHFSQGSPEFDCLSSKTPSLQSISIGQNESESLNVKLIKKTDQNKKPISNIVFPSITNIAALFVKNSITMKRNILLLLFVFFLPAIVLFVNSITIG